MSDAQWYQYTFNNHGDAWAFLTEVCESVQGAFRLGSSVYSPAQPSTVGPVWLAMREHLHYGACRHALVTAAAVEEARIRWRVLQEGQP